MHWMSVKINSNTLMCFSSSSNIFHYPGCYSNPYYNTYSTLISPFISLVFSKYYYSSGSPQIIVMFWKAILSFWTNSKNKCINFVHFESILIYLRTENPQNWFVWISDRSVRLGESHSAAVWINSDSTDIKCFDIILIEKNVDGRI